MGFFDFGGSKVEHSTTIPPDRSKRIKCWEARDAFFKCLDDNSIIDSIKHDNEARARCGAQAKLFEQDCVASWVEYFKKRRVMEDKKAKALEAIGKEGAEEVGTLKTKSVR